MNAVPEVSFKNSTLNLLGLEIVSFEDLAKTFEQGLNHNPFNDHRLKFNALFAIGEGGSGSHSVDFKRHTYEGSSVILVSSDQVQSFIDLPQKNEGLLLMFTDSLFLEIGADYPFIIGHFFNNQLYDPVHNLPKEDFKDLIALLNKIKSKTKDKRKSVRVEVIKGYFKILLLEMFACREKRYEEINKSVDTRHFIEFQKLLKAHFVKEKKVKFYADALHITTKKLNEISKSVIGKTAKNFILSFVVLEAKKRLVLSSASTKEVGYELGFDEPTNFTKFFKTHTNTIPSDFSASISDN
ncbi:MAG: helix-turn-helix domain-containing protein [Bacteroidota bacterium]